MKKSIMVFFLVFLLIKVNAQNSVEGIVYDENGKILVGASVYFPELNKGSTTDSKGSFFIGDLPKGKQKIQISFIGYITEFISLDLSSQENTIEVHMQQAVLKSQEVVVSGGYVSSQHENAVKIDILSIDDIIKSGTPNFMEALTNVPGVDMISKGPGVAKPVIRGLSMNDILVLNNGVRIENYQYSENHPLGIDQTDIERVEIIKGPASLLYGSDAIGGVLNFIKEKPASIGATDIKYFGVFNSNTLGFDNNISVKSSGKGLFAGINIGHKTHNDYLQGGGEYVPNSKFNEKTLSLCSGFSGKKGVYRLYYDYFKQDLGMSVPPAISLISERSRENQFWFQDLEHHMLSSQNRMYFGSIKVLLNLSGQSALRKLQTSLDEPFVEMRLNTFTWDGKLFYDLDDKNEFVLATQGMMQDNENLNDRLSQFLPNANIINTGFAALINSKIKDFLQLQAGIRYDLSNIETFGLGIEGESNYHAPLERGFNSLSGSVGMTINPGEKTNIRFNFAKAYRTPNLSELTSNGMHGSRYELGNSELVPQDAYEADASVHYHGEYLSFDIAWFYNMIDNYIFISPTEDTAANGTSIYEFAQTRADLYGGEAVVHFHPKLIPWLHLKGSFNTVVGLQENGDYLPFIPSSKLRYELRIGQREFLGLENAYLNISAVSSFAQNKPARFETSTEAYNIFNVGVFSEIPLRRIRISMGISINNIFDTQYIDHLSTLKPLGYYGMGRNISLSLKIPVIVE